MRPPRAAFLIALIPSFALAQNAPGYTSGPAPAPSSLADEVQLLRALMADQQKQLAEQQNQIAQLRQQLNAAPRPASANAGDSASTPHLINAGLNTAGLNSPLSTPSLVQPAGAASDSAPSTESPLSFRIGGADFTPGGIMDFDTIFRTTNTGNVGTNFFAIPFSNTVGGNLTETRMTAQNSRVSLKATEKFGKNDVTGYVEIDFIGNDAANVQVTASSHTVRQRLYWVDLKRDKWEFLGGQSWSWLTPNRVGLSPAPADIFYSCDFDFNYQVGLTWTRAPQVRVVYHPDEHWAFGVALENPQQFGGQGEVTFPFAFNAQLGVQIDQATLSGAPNLHPDIIPKVAYDTNVGGKHFHGELAGLFTGVKVTNTVGGVFRKHTNEGEGVEAAANLELFKNFHFVMSGFYSSGGGRYIFSMGPDAVVLPNALGTDVRVSLVHSGSGIAGLEYQVRPHTLLYGYYGAAYFQRNFALDTTAGATQGSFAGFGYPGSPTSHNRDIQEPSIGWTQVFWKNPQYGALQLGTQVSYLTRSPWFVPSRAPKNARLVMVWEDFRYILP